MGNAGGHANGRSRRDRFVRGNGPKCGVEISLDDFRCPRGFVSHVGIGGFGKVLAMVRKDDPTKRFAVKCMHKGKVLHKGQTANVLNELNILRRLDHRPHLVNLFYAFQDRDYLYFCTDLMLGGTLQRALKRMPEGSFASQPERIRLYAAELLLALQFLHSNNVVHRDVKPDNVLLDANGHLHLTDFNVSIYVEPGKEETQKHEDGWGTRGYRAPEVYLRTGTGYIFACDWWSYGALVYELFVGSVPYSRLSKDEPSSELLMRMHAELADFSMMEDAVAVDFLSKLLRFDPELRLGCQHGSNSEVIIMTHPFFKDTDWDALENHKNPNEIDSSEDSRTTENSELLDTDFSLGVVSQSSGEASGRKLSIQDFNRNFDTSLDKKERLRVLQRNMGILGLNGFDNQEEDDFDYPRIKPENQHLFRDWAYNVDFKLEQQQRPQFTLLQQVSSMAPEQIRTWITKSTHQTLRGLCSEMKAYREQAMRENFDHAMAQVRIDRLIEENLKLTRKIAELGKQLGVATSSAQEESFGFKDSSAKLRQNLERSLKRAESDKSDAVSSLETEGEDVILFKSRSDSMSGHPTNELAMELLPSGKVQVKEEKKDEGDQDAKVDDYDDEAFEKVIRERLESQDSLQIL